IGCRGFGPAFGGVTTLKILRLATTICVTLIRTGKSQNMENDNSRDSLEEFEEDITEYIGKNEHGRELALPEQSLPKRMYVLPVSNRPFFPAQVQPVMVNQNPWQETLKRVGETDHKMLGICFVDDHPSDQSIPESEELETVG